MRYNTLATTVLTLALAAATLFALPAWAGGPPTEPVMAEAATAGPGHAGVVPNTRMGYESETPRHPPAPAFGAEGADRLNAAETWMIANDARSWTRTPKRHADTTTRTLLPGPGETGGAGQYDVQTSRRRQRVRPGRQVHREGDHGPGGGSDIPS